MQYNFIKFVCTAKGRHKKYDEIKFVLRSFKEGIQFVYKIVFTSREHKPHACDEVVRFEV